MDPLRDPQEDQRNIGGYSAVLYCLFVLQFSESAVPTLDERCNNHMDIDILIHVFNFSLQILTISISFSVNKFNLSNRKASLITKATEICNFYFQKKFLFSKETALFYHAMKD